MAANPQYKVYKTDADKAKLYNQRLARAEKDFDKWSGQGKDWWDRYENVPKAAQSTPKGHVVNVPTGVATIDALFSGLTAVDVEFVMKPVGATTPATALLAEAAVNEEWERCDVDEERDAAIKDALIVGIGIVKVGYDFFAEEVEVDREPEDVAREVRQLLREAEEAGLPSPDPAVIGQLVPTTEMLEEVKRDRIVTDYVPWDQIRWDPTAKRWPDVRWVAQLTKMSLEEVRENPLWRAYLKRSRKAGGTKQLDDVKADSTIDKELLLGYKSMEDEDRVTVVEYWDLETGTICTFLKGHHFLLYEGVNPYALAHDYEDRSPFVPLVLRSTNRRVRGIGDMEVMLRSLNEKNLYRSKTANYLDRVNPKLIGPEDALTDEGKQALASPEIGSYVSVDRAQDPKSISPLTPPPLMPEAYNMNDRIDNEIREATGVNELMRGLFPDRKRTATETNEVVSASAARQSEKRNTLSRFHEAVAERILLLMQKFYDKERMLRYVDPTTFGEVEWEFTGAELVGEFTIHANLSPRDFETRDAMRQEATVLLNVLGPFTEPDQQGKAPLHKESLLAFFMAKYGLDKREINELLQGPAEQQVQAAGAQQVAAGGPPPGPLSPNEMLAAANGPNVITDALGVQGPPM